VASAEQVERELQVLVDRLARADPKVHAELDRTLGGSRLVVMEVPDLRTTFWSELAGGKMGPVQQGEPPRADIRITADSDDLIAMMEGTKPLFSSYLAGHVKVQASVTDLLALRKLM
jgi:predicted lipid carrier protein YhbT